MRYPKLQPTKTTIAGLVLVLSLCAQALVPFLAQNASAGTLANTMVRFDRLGASVQTTGTVCAKTSAVNGTEASVLVTFPAGFTLGTAANFTINTTNTGWPTGATAWLGINTATNVTGQAVTFPSSDLAVSTLYCFNWANNAAVKTGAAGNYSGSVTTQTSAPAAIDTGNYATTIVTGNTDQVQVSAQVNPAFSMSLSPNSDALGTLTTGAVTSSSSPIVATISTNAANGWYLWGKDSNAGLNSLTVSYTIASNCASGAGTNTTLSAGTEGYNLGATVTSQGTGSGGTAATTGTGLVFDNAGGSTPKGAGLCTTYQSIANSNGTANGATISMKNNAAISGITKPATDYTDTETFVGAGLF